MIDYAKISSMANFQKNGIWPLNSFPQNSTIQIKNQLSDAVRILMKRGPIKSFYRKQILEIPTEVFRSGTRGWEYPWAIQVIKGNLKNNAKVLDCGCGLSMFPVELCKMGFNAYGLDYLKGVHFKDKGYGLTKKHINKYSQFVKYIFGGMEKIPVEDNTFDATTCMSVMEHVVIAHKIDPTFHLKCLEEKMRVLKPGGLMICSYDTILDKNVVYSNKYGWGENGWYYKEDIEYMLSNGMKLLKSMKIPERVNIIQDDDAYFIPPDFYFSYGYGQGFENFGSYHKLTSVGFVLQKK